MTTRSLDTMMIIDDPETAKRFAEGYRDFLSREKKELPDASELLEKGRRLLESGALD
jgi:hypothetical protein